MRGGKKDTKIVQSNQGVLDPVKLIYKYKNNNRRVQYQVYIFLGNIAMDDHVLKLHRKIQDTNMFDSLIKLTQKEVTDFVNLYGEFWYRKLFISHHIFATLDTIRNNPTKKKEITDKFGKEWYDKHVAGVTFIDRTIFSYQSLVKEEREMKKKLQKQKKEDDDEDEADVLQTGGDPDEGDDEDEQIQDEDNDEEEEFDEENLTEVSDDDIIIEEEVDTKNVKKIAELVNEVIHKNEDDERNTKLEKMTPFDESKNDKPYDETLKNIFTKNYVFNQYIYGDDTIKKIKQKICAGILFSDVFNKKYPYLIPSRMYLWSEYEYWEKGKDIVKRDKLMLGQKWIVRNEILPIDIEPDDNIKTFENIKGNLRTLRDNMRKYSSRIKYENDENNVLDDYDEFINNNEIYMIDIYHELGLDYKTDIELIRNVYDVYIKIYFPGINNEDYTHILDYLNAKEGADNKKEYELNKIVSTYQAISTDLLLENEVMSTVENLRHNTEYDQYFKPNFVTQTSINVNLSYINHSVSTKIDLYRIFDSFVVSDKYPFVQFQTQDGKLVFKFYQMSDETDKKTIMSKWFENSPYGLSFKVKIDSIKSSNNKYIAINMSETGRIDYKTQWKEEDEIDFEYIKNTFDDVVALLKKINDENTKVHFNIPEQHHFKYAFINTIQQFTLPEKFVINHNDMSDFARYFFPYISVVVDPRKRSSSQKSVEMSKYGTYLRYKRVSKFDNDARIDHRIIHFLRNYEYVPKLLAEELSRQFNITEKEAIERVEQVRARYPVLKKTRRVLKKFENIPKYKPPGIGIDIQGKSRDNYKIRVTGARSKEQLHRINQFIKVLINLYSETYLYKNKKYQQLKEKLKSLTNIAKRRNKVEEIVEEDKEIKSIKQITKLDKSRVGFKPEKGQNHWTRSCQNSGNKKRQPVPFRDVEDLVRQGYVYNKTTEQYEKKVRVGKTEMVVKAVPLDDNQGGQLYWTCETTNNNKFVHIGFLSRSQNPNGICMPCCFKKDPLMSKNKDKKEYHRKCLGKSSNEGVSRKGIGDKLYILQDTNKMLPERLGFLPSYLDLYFNTFLNYNIELKNHYLVKTEQYFLKFGSIQEEFPYMNAVGAAFDVSIPDVKKKVVDALRANPVLFVTLNNGDIKTQFQSLDNYIHFIETNTYIDNNLIEDVLCTPGVLYPEGVNIYVFEKSDDSKNDFVVACRNPESMVYFKDPKRVNIFIVKENNNFFPVFLVKKSTKDSNVKIERMFYYSEILEHIWSYFNSNCTGINLSDDMLPIAKVLYNRLDTARIKSQIVDIRNKCRYIVTDELIIPVKPSGCLYNLPVETTYTDHLKPLDESIKRLHKLKMKEYTPRGFIYETNDGEQTITAIALSKVIYLPVIPTPRDNNQLKELISLFGVADFDVTELSLYDKIDEEIIKENPEIIYDERIMQVNRNKFINEGYELFRLELSNHLANTPDVKKKLMSLIEEGDANKIKRFMYSIINKTLEKEFVDALKQTGGFMETIDELPDIKTYRTKNNRELCSSLHGDMCGKNLHCRVVGDKCMFHVTKDNLVDYINRLTSELLNNEIKMKEVMNIDNYYVSDIISYDVFTRRPDQKIIKSDNNNINKIMEELFGKKNVPIIGRKKKQRLQKSMMEENQRNMIRKAGDNLYQNIIAHNALFRAYANGFYWLKNKGASIVYRNLGYFSDLQTNLSNYFRSLVFDWILDTKNADVLDVNIEDFKHQLASSKDITLFGKNELYVLNQLHNIPIVVYDQYETVIMVVDGEVKFDVKEVPSEAIQMQFFLTDQFSIQKMKSISVTKVVSVYAS